MIQEQRSILYNRPCDIKVFIAFRAESINKSAQWAERNASLTPPLTRVPPVFTHWILLTFCRLYTRGPGGESLQRLSLWHWRWHIHLLQRKYGGSAEFSACLKAASVCWSKHAPPASTPIPAPPAAKQGTDLKLCTSWWCQEHVVREIGAQLWRLAKSKRGSSAEDMEEKIMSNPLLPALETAGSVGGSITIGRKHVTLLPLSLWSVNTLHPSRLCTLPPLVLLPPHHHIWACSQSTGHLFFCVFLQIRMTQGQCSLKHHLQSVLMRSSMVLQADGSTIMTINHVSRKKIIKCVYIYVHIVQREIQLLTYCVIFCNVLKAPKIVQALKMSEWRVLKEKSNYIHVMFLSALPSG